MPISVEALAYYRERLWVRNVHYLVELDPATGKRLRLGDASWGWGGMAFQKNKLFVSGIQSQYGKSGATVTDLDDVGKEITKFPTLEGVIASGPSTSTTTRNSPRWGRHWSSATTSVSPRSKARSL